MVDKIEWIQMKGKGWVRGLQGVEASIGDYHALKAMDKDQLVKEER
jgi:hypothetical protein